MGLAKRYSTQSLILLVVLLAMAAPSRDAEAINERQVKGWNFVPRTVWKNFFNAKAAAHILYASAGCVSVGKLSPEEYHQQISTHLTNEDTARANLNPQFAKSLEAAAQHHIGQMVGHAGAVSLSSPLYSGSGKSGKLTVLGEWGFTPDSGLVKIKVGSFPAKIDRGGTTEVRVAEQLLGFRRSNDRRSRKVSPKASPEILVHGAALLVPSRAQLEAFQQRAIDPASVQNEYAGFLPTRREVIAASLAAQFDNREIDPSSLHIEPQPDSAESSFLVTGRITKADSFGGIFSDGMAGDPFKVYAHFDRDGGIVNVLGKAIYMNGWGDAKPKE